MSSIQRSLNTLQCYTGTQNGVLIIEVSAIQRFVIERFHCITIIHGYYIGYNGKLAIMAGKVSKGSVVKRSG